MALTSFFYLFNFYFSMKKINYFFVVCTIMLFNVGELLLITELN